MIRRMQEIDLLQVAELERNYFSVPWSLNGLTESFHNPAYLFLVAEEAGRVIGYAGLIRLADEGDITNIVIDEAFRGRGTGTELTGQLLEEGGKLGIRAFTLEVRVSNASAIHVYEKLGFVSEGVRKRFYEKPVEDAMIMWKRTPESDQ
jgi:ribosomal-protein-alanine N-acetyltransferase